MCFWGFCVYLTPLFLVLPKLRVSREHRPLTE